MELAASRRIWPSSSRLGTGSPASSAASRIRPESNMKGNSSASTCSGSPYSYQSASDKMTPSRYPSHQVARSEEHTSELQSPDHLVCRLLLEKKKKKRDIVTHSVTLDTC